MTPKKIHILTRDLEILDAETPLTRAWASLNPHEDRTEYTDLSQVWHNIYEIPVNKNRLILLYDKYNCVHLEFIPYDVVNHLTQRMWNWYIENEEFVAWAYVNDLLPKKVSYENVVSKKQR